jgi:hypothetical protein
MYGRRKEFFGTIHHFYSCESEQYKIITPLSFAPGLSLNQVERQPIKSNQDENNCRQQQMLNAQYIKMSINRASKICGLVSTVIHQ